jgi:predicted lysophospholipase L1 biosynthesis ABC-type transport system permease subunit
VTAEFVDRVINDWLRENDLLGGRFVSHVTSLSLPGPEGAARKQGSSMSLAVYIWIVLFAVVSGAVLGYLRMAERAGELELARTVGASPLHIRLQIGLENLLLAILGSTIGVLVSTLVARPLLVSLADLDHAPVGSLRLWLLTMTLAFLSSTAGSVRFAMSRRIL